MSDAGTPVPTPNTNPPKLSFKRPLTIAGIVLLVIVSFITGVNSADTVSLERLGIKLLNPAPPGGLTTVDYSLLWKVLREVNEDYVDRPLDQKQLMYGAVAGLVEALGDPHSNFLNPEENAEFQSDLSGNFDGIGAEVAIKEEK